MEIYKVVFFDYEGEDYYFCANSIKDAKIKAEKWAKIMNEKERGEEYNKIREIAFELETEN